MRLKQEANARRSKPLSMLVPQWRDARGSAAVMSLDCDSEAEVRVQRRRRRRIPDDSN